MSNEYDEAAASLIASKWLQIQTDLTVAFSQGFDGEKIGNAAAHFMVARQFPKRSLTRSDDFAGVIVPLQKASDQVNRSNVAGRVIELADTLKAVPGLTRGRPISAASKLLWCAKPEIGIIYDQHARKKLARLGHRVPHRDYDAYVRAFEIESLKRRRGLELGLAKCGLIGAPWLTEKLLDHWLYLNGRPN